MNNNVYMPYLEIVVTTKCTLRCKDCANLIQYYNEPYHIDVDIIKKSVERLLEVVNKIDMLRILGGEPFLYPNLNEILDLLISSDKIKSVQIVTNGTIIITENSLINMLRNNKVSISISDYGNISSKKSQLINLGRRAGIKIIQSKTSHWIDFGNIECRNRNTVELKNQYNRCNQMCKSLLKGKVFNCPRSAHGRDLGIISDNPNEYIDLLDTRKTIDNLRDEIINLYNKNGKFMQMCNYCDVGYNSKRIPVASQLKK